MASSIRIRAHQLSHQLASAIKHRRTLRPAFKDVFLEAVAIYDAAFLQLRGEVQHDPRHSFAARR